MKPLSTRVRDHLRSNIYGLIAVFIALGGTAVALPGRNTVDSGDIRNGQVKSSDVAQNSLTGGDINESTLIGFAGAGHNHDGAYAPLGHNHDAFYASLGHNHDSDYAALGHNHDAAYAALGHNHDATYVNEGQANSVSQGMVQDTERSVSLQLGGFHRCDVASSAGYLDFSSDADTAPDFALLGTHGGPVAVVWDDDSGNTDIQSDICTQFVVPSDYASGGSFRIRVGKESETSPGSESMFCQIAGTAGSALTLISGVAAADRTCTPSASYSPGLTVPLTLHVSATTAFDDPVQLFSVAWTYNSTG